MIAESVKSIIFATSVEKQSIMEWFKISTPTELIRVATDEIVFISADGNYSNMMLTNGETRTITLQLHSFEKYLQKLRMNPFLRVGRSLIVNKRYIHIINLTRQELVFSGQTITGEIPTVRVSREALKALKEIMEKKEQNDE